MTKTRRLKRILDVKEKVQRVRLGELAEATAEVDAATAHTNQVLQQRDAAIRTLVQAGEVTAEELASRSVMVRHSEKNLARARESLRTVEAEQARRAEIAVSAGREVKALEVVRDHLAAEQALELRKFEQSESDEAASRGRSTP